MQKRHSINRVEKDIWYNTVFESRKYKCAKGIPIGSADSNPAITRMMVSKRFCINTISLGVLQMNVAIATGR